MKLMFFIRKLQKEIISPWVALPLVYLLFLALAFISYEIPNTSKFLLQPSGSFKTNPSLISYLISLIGIFILFLAAIFGGRINIMRKTPVIFLIFFFSILSLKLAFSIGLIYIVPASLGYIVLLWYISKRLNNLKILALLAGVLAVISSMVILFKGIPIFESTIRESTAVTPARALFHGFATVSAALFIVSYSKKFAFPAIIILVFLGVLSGFKSDSVAILISAVIAGILVKRISLKETLLAVLFVLLILTFLSNFIAVSAYGAWEISPLLYIFYRAGFTLGVFSNIVDMSMPFGLLKGNAILSISQEIISIEVLDYQTPHIITSTFLGPWMLDFGILGVIFVSLLLGLYIGALYKSANTKTQFALYSVALTHSFILVEVGLQLTSIIFFLSILYLTIGSNELEGPT